jgi:molecular chaperone GrpE
MFSDEAKTAAEGAASAGTAKPVQTANGSATSQPDADTIATLQNEIKSLKDQLLRSYAEGENIRRIAARDVDNSRAYAVSSFAKATLDIADDLDRALSVVPAEHRQSSDPVLSQLVVGIELTHKNLSKILGQFGVVKYGTVGDKFDPNIHEALFKIPDAAEPDTVGQIVKMGYKIKDRVLRPAQVGARIKPEA